MKVRWRLLQGYRSAEKRTVSERLMMPMNMLWKYSVLTEEAGREDMIPRETLYMKKHRKRAARQDITVMTRMTGLSV